MGKASLLITGFGPFPGVRINPTTALMRSVVRRLGGQPVANGALLTVRYDTARQQFADALDRCQPDAVLLLGLASRARWVRIERHARLGDSPLHPDAAGRGGQGNSGGGSSRPLSATVPPEPALALFRRAGVRARLSASAGRYLCNAVYAEALVRSEGRPTLFVHIPRPRAAAGTVPAERIRRRKPTQAELAAVLADVARYLAITARRAGTGQHRLA